MALVAVWAFGGENVDLMKSDMGWSGSAADGLNGCLVTNSDVYSYAGSPTRWTVQLGFAQSFFLPPTMQSQSPGNQGVYSFALRFTSVGSISGDIIRTNYSMTFSPFSTASWVTVATSTTLALYAGGAFQGTTAPLDLTNWNYITYKHDPTAPNYSAELWVNGVLEVSGSNGPYSANVDNGADTYLAGNGATAFGNGVAFWDSWADSGAPTPRFITYVDPNEDLAGKTTGTWTPGGTGPPASNNAAVASPLDTATYTQEATPASTERVTLGIKNGAADTLATALGVTPSAIDGISCWNWSTGQVVNARAVLSDGTNEDLGASTVIDAVNTTTTHVCAETRADGGSTPWAGSDQPEMAYEIV